MNAIIERINEIGGGFVEFALPMLIQSGVLILILLLVDLLLRKRVRAVFRYWIWMLVLVKLVLPTSLSSPVSVGRWFGDKLAYVDVNPAPEPLPEADVAPAPAPAPVPEIPPIVDLPPRIEAVRHTPEVVPAEPTIQRAEPAAAEPTGPPPPPAPAMPPLSWRGAAFLAWLGVLTIMALLLGQRALFVRRLVAQAGRANNSMAETLADCRGRMAVKAKVGLKVSGGAASPAVCGLLRPVILVPENLTPSLGSSELRVVLLHELAHIKRSDLWVNFAQTLLQIFYFYNPLLWLANAMIRRSREQAVDEMVLVAMGEKARQYPQTLVNVAKLAFKRPALSLRLIGVVESKSALTGRIKHILSRPIPKSAKLGIVGLLAVVIAAVFLLPMAKSELADRDLLIKFSDCLPGPVKTVGPGDKATWSTSYNVTFTEGEELFVVAELYQAGKPMRVLGRKVFRGSTDLERLSVHLTRAYGNEAKTVLMHSAKVQLGGQILDIPEFTVEADRFHYGEGWGRYGGLDLRRKRHQRTGREYARLENLFNWFNGSGGDPKEGQVYFWIPGRRINQTPSHHHIRFKMAPLSQLKHLTGYATAGRQGLDGKPIPDYLPEEQAAEMAEQYFMKLTMPLPELTAHKYYKVGDPIQIYVQERGSGKWKPTLGEIDHDGDVSPMFFLIDGREYASRTGFGPFGSGGHTLHLPGELYVDSGSFRLSPGRHTVAYGWKNLDVVNPDEPERAVHYDTLATDVVEFEVVEELPADYYFEVYEDGWEDILRRSIETPFTDDMKKYHISGPLLALQVGSLPFDIAFEIYAQAEGSEDTMAPDSRAVKGSRNAAPADSALLRPGIRDRMGGVREIRPIRGEPPPGLYSRYSRPEHAPLRRYGEGRQTRRSRSSKRTLERRCKRSLAVARRIRIGLESRRRRHPANKSGFERKNALAAGGKCQPEPGSR